MVTEHCRLTGVYQTLATKGSTSWEVSASLETYGGLRYFTYTVDRQVLAYKKETYHNYRSYADMV